jgi:hypothetical protein
MTKQDERDLATVEEWEAEQVLGALYFSTPVFRAVDVGDEPYDDDDDAACFALVDAEYDEFRNY